MSEKENSLTETEQTATHIEDVQSSFPETTYEQDMEKYTKIDNLDEDKGDESYVLVSFASPEGIMNCTVRALKIRIYNNQSVFKTYEQASAAAKELNKYDKFFPIFVMPTGKWCAWDPNPDDKTKVAEQKYADENQQKIMDGLDQVEKKKLEMERLKNKQEKDMTEMNALIGKTKDKINTASKDHKQRVKDSIKQGIEEKDTPKKELKQPLVQQNTHDTSKLKEKLRAKLAEKKRSESETEAKPTELSKQVEELTEQVRSTSQTSTKLEENINKAKDLLEKMKQKKQEASA
jgi:hypothetical protein